MAIGNQSDQFEIVETILAQKLSVRDTERLANEYRKSDSATASTTVERQDNAKSADVRQLERAVTRIVGCHFEIRDHEAVFDFYGDLDILQGVLEKLGYAAR